MIFTRKCSGKKCSGNFKLKARCIAKKKRVCHFCLNKNYCISYIINKINGEKVKKIVYTKCFLFTLLTHAQCITEVTARRCFVRNLLLKLINCY